jgi:hypothetical protein
MVNSRRYGSGPLHRLCRLSKRSKPAKQYPVVDPHQIVRHLIHAQSDCLETLEGDL